MAFDLKAKATLVEVEEQGIDVPIKDEVGKPVYNLDGTTPATIRVVGPLSKRYRKAQRISRGRALNRPARRETDDETIGERSFADATDAIAECILGWSDGFTDGGEPFPCTKPNAVKLLTAFPFIQAQLEAAIEDHGHFLPATSSS